MLTKSIDFGAQLSGAVERDVLSQDRDAEAEAALLAQRNAIHADAHSILGDSLVELDNFDRAREEYHRALAIFEQCESNSLGDWPVGDTLAKLAALDIEAAVMGEDVESRTALSSAALESIDRLEAETFKFINDTTGALSGSDQQIRDLSLIHI